MQDSRVLRWTDRYVGSAMCRLLSITRVVFGRSQATQRQPRKVLLVELFEMGAAVMLVPSIRFLRQQEPAVELHVLTTRSCYPIWKALALIEPERLHVIDSGSSGKFLFGLIGKVWQLRRTHFDLVIDYELFMRISSLISGVLSTALRSGFYRYSLEGLYRGSFYDRICSYNQNNHIAKNYLALTKTAFLGAADLPNFKGPLVDSDLDLGLKPWQKNSALVAQLIRKGANNVDVPFSRFIAICPDVGKTLAVRNYPRPQFAEVIVKLHERFPDYGFVFIGTKEDEAAACEILERANIGKFAVNLCGSTSFQELLEIIGSAELLLTNDNGPAHFATLTDTKTLALFSTDSPFVYGPLGKALIAYSYYHCSPCIFAFNHKNSLCSDNKCLQAITPESVANLAELLLRGQAHYRTINNKIPYIY